jgi:hypothetical protein
MIAQLTTTSKSVTGFRLMIAVVLITVVSCHSSIQKNGTLPNKQQQQDTGAVEIDEPLDNGRAVSKPAANPSYITVSNGKLTEFDFSIFSVTLYNFVVFNDVYGYGQYNYNGDTSQVSLSGQSKSEATVGANRDTVSVQEDPVNSIKEVVFEIKPGFDHEKDEYKFSYAFESSLDKWFGSSSQPVQPVVIWKGMTRYKQVKEIEQTKDTLNHYFAIDQNVYNSKGQEETIRKLNIRDRLVKNPGKPEQVTVLTYKQKKCTYNPVAIYLRMERDSAKIYKETKYIIINFQEYNDD